MPTLRYGRGSQIAEYHANGILMFDTSAVTEIGLMTMPNCAILLIEDEVSTVDRWSGERPQRNEWRKGSVRYLPGASDLASRPERPYSETIISVEDQMLIDRACSYIKNSAVDMRYADVTSDDATGIARALRGLLVSGEAENWPLLTDSLAMALMMSASKGVALANGRSLRATPRGGLGQVRQRRVLQFIDAHISDPIRLNDMAQTAALSPFHFCRAFKATFGMSPARYVLERRLREAQHLLKVTRKPLTDVAMDCGFASQSHFITAFKAALGVTPKQFRNSEAA